MTGAEIARALGSAHRDGRNWRCRCPVHGGRSLALRDGPRDRLLIHCFGGCDGREVWNALCELGLIERRDDRFDPRRHEEFRRRTAMAANAEIDKLRRQISRARALYGSARPAAGTAAETYWCSRGLAIPIPPVLRYLQHCLHRNGHYYPGLVAPIVDRYGRQTAVHLTFLKRDGSGKADLPKDQQRQVIGPMKGGAVRLADRHSDAPLLVGEGMESTASAMQMFSLPGWAALCADGISAVELPDDIRDVWICADNDENATGQRAAVAACQRLTTAKERRVRVLLPPVADTDFNDILMQGTRP